MKLMTLTNYLNQYNNNGETLNVISSKLMKSLLNKAKSFTIFIGYDLTLSKKDKILASILFTSIALFKTYKYFKTPDNIVNNNLLNNGPISDVIQLVGTNLDNHAMMNQLIQVFELKARDDYSIRKKWADPTFVALLCTAGHRVLSINPHEETLLSQHQVDQQFLTLLEKGQIFALLTLVHYLINEFKDTREIPYSYIYDLAVVGGYPVEIMVANVMARLILAKKCVRVCVYCVQAGFHHIFFKLIRYEKEKEFKTIRLALLLMLSVFGEEGIQMVFKDQPQYIQESQEFLLRNSKLPRAVNAIRFFYGIDSFYIQWKFILPRLTYTTILSFFTGIYYGWKLHHNTKDSLLVGLGWTLIRSSSWLILTMANMWLIGNRWSKPRQLICGALDWSAIAYQVFLAKKYLLSELVFYFGFSVVCNLEKDIVRRRRLTYLRNDLYKEYQSKFKLTEKSTIFDE